MRKIYIITTIIEPASTPVLFYTNDLTVRADALCSRLPEFGWTGTYGRDCLPNARQTTTVSAIMSASASVSAVETLPLCSYVCCGRGYGVRYEPVERQCNCVWDVDTFNFRCDVCTSMITVNYCFWLISSWLDRLFDYYNLPKYVKSSRRLTIWHKE